MTELAAVDDTREFGRRLPSGGEWAARLEKLSPGAGEWAARLEKLSPGAGDEAARLETL